MEYEILELKEDKRQLEVIIRYNGTIRSFYFPYEKAHLMKQSDGKPACFHHIEQVLDREVQQEPPMDSVVSLNAEFAGKKLVKSDMASHRMNRVDRKAKRIQRIKQKIAGVKQLRERKLAKGQEELVKKGDRVIAALEKELEVLENGSS